MYPVEGNKCEFLISSGEHELLGFSFGSDFSTEHECGIEEIRKAFGVCPMDWSNRSNDHLTGIERRKITKLPYHLRLFSGGGAARLQFNTSCRLLTGEQDSLRRSTRSAWSDSAFVIESCDTDDLLLKRLWKHIEALDVIFTMRSDGLSSGFTILVASAVSKEEAWNWIASDQERIVLYTEASPILQHIHEVLNKAGKTWHSLREPCRITGKLRFWLNPTHQDIYNYGWFTPEELLLWAENKGPIVIGKRTVEETTTKRKKRVRN